MSSNDFVKQARAHFDRGAFQDAANVCRRGLLASPDEVEGRLILGRSLMALQRYGEVLAEVRVLLDREPGNAQGLALKGEALLYKGDVAKAVQTLREAHTAAPRDAAIRAMREQAENAATKDASAFIFVNEDPSATMTRHYPSRPGQPPLQREPGSARTADADAQMLDGILGKQPAAPASGEGTPREGRSTLPARPQNVQPQARSARPTGAPPPGNAPASPRSAPPPGNAPASPRSVTPPVSPAPPPARAGQPAGAPAKAPAARRGPAADPNLTFDEPTAIYGDAQMGKPFPQPVPPRDVSVQPAPAAAQPSFPGAGASPDESVDRPPEDSDVSLDASEFDEDMAPTAMIEVERPWRAKPATSAAPAARPPAQEATVEALPPVGPRSTFPAAVPPAPARNMPLPAAQTAGLPSLAPPDQRSSAPATAGSPPRATPRSMPQATPQAAPQAPPRSMPQAPPQAAPQAPPRSIPQAPPRSIPQAPPQAMPQAPPRSMPQAPPRSMPQASPQAAPQPAPAVAARSAPVASYEPTVAVPRQSQRSRQRSRVWQYVLVALVVIGGGAVGGLQIRKLRLDWEIDTARTRAGELMALDTYAGYLRARNVYASIVAVRATPGDQSALARSQAALATEFDEGYAEAQAAVRALGDSGATDAVLARAYLALADRDAAGALAQANALASQAPDDPFAAYLVGRARLLTGDHTGALDAFQKAVERSARPLFLVWLGRAHLALGQQDKAAAAFTRALERVPGHPVALLGRAELAAAGTEPAPDGLEASLEALIVEGARPLAEQAIGVSSGEVAGATLALVGLRMQRGDEPGARKALEQLQGMRREGDPGFAVILARALERLGDTDAALAELARAVEAGPTRLDARLAWAELALRAGKLDAARAALLDIDEPTSEVIARNVSALALRGRTHLALGALDRALADLDAALAEHPDGPELLRARAEIDLLQGNAVAAAKRLAPVAGADAPSEMRVFYAEALRSSGQYDQARAVLDAVQKAPSPPPRTYLELARIARDQGRWVEARNAYADAIERLKGADGAPAASADARLAARTEARTEARIEAVRVALDTGDRTGAREAITAMAKEGATRNDGRVLVEAARSHTLDGAHDQAAEYLERAAALASPPQPGLARERGRLALRRGDAKAAARELEAVRSMAGGDPETLLLLIEADLAQGKGEAAAALYEEVARRPSVNPAVLSMAAGLVAAAGGKPDEALAAFEQTRALLTERAAAPRYIAQVDFLIGRTLFEYDRLREAKKALEKAIRADPTRADPYFVLGMVEYGGSDFGDAADAFEEAIQRDAASLPEAWFYLGEVELERDHKSEARDAFQAYLELRPEGAKAADAKRYLSEPRRVAGRVPSGATAALARRRDLGDRGEVPAAVCTRRAIPGRIFDQRVGQRAARVCALTARSGDDCLSRFVYCSGFGPEPKEETFVQMRNCFHLCSVAVLGVSFAACAMDGDQLTEVVDTTTAPLHDAARGIPDRYIVVFKDQIGASGVDAAVSRIALRTSFSRIDSTFTVIPGFAARLSAEDLAAIRQNPDVAYVERDQLVEIDPAVRAQLASQSGELSGPLSSEPEFGIQTIFPLPGGQPDGIDRVDQPSLPRNSQYNDHGCDGAGARAYVIDTGIRTRHVELGGRVNTARGFTAISDGRGTDDCIGQGTFLASVIGGVQLGLAKQVTLVPVRVLSCAGSGTFSGIISGVNHVRQRLWPQRQVRGHDGPGRLGLLGAQQRGRQPDRQRCAGHRAGRHQRLQRFADQSAVGHGRGRRQRHRLPGRHRRLMRRSLRPEHDHPRCQRQQQHGHPDPQQRRRCRRACGRRAGAGHELRLHRHPHHDCDVRVPGGHGLAGHQRLRRRVLCWPLRRVRRPQAVPVRR